MPTDSRTEIISTFSMVRLSLLPQYWAERMDAPEETPKSSICSTKATLEAREAAASSVLPTMVSITTSAELTHASMKFWNAMGSVMRAKSL